MRFATKTIHSGYHPHGHSEPVVPPIQPSTIFTHPEDGFDSRPGSFGYARYGNPNRSELEQVLTSLENGAVSTVFSSGMTAITAVFQALHPGDHVVVCDDVYHGTRAILNGIMQRWGLEVSYVDFRFPERVEATLRPNTKVVWLETPSNPMVYVTDIRDICERVRRFEQSATEPILVAVDNTWATPVLQNPLDLGADIVMHSCTKYLGGHSDVLAGALIFKRDDAFTQRVRETHKQVGAVLPAFDSWLLVRSIKSLSARMRVHCENARQIAAFLNQHPKIEAVYYPGLEHAQGHTIASTQMKDFGGMISMQIKASRESVLKGIHRAKLIITATSLGGVESIWEHRQSSEGPTSKTPENLVRISVGIEDANDLIDDIDAVLQTL